jgi:hypothetical protein
MTSADRFWRRHWALTLLEDRKATDGVDVESVALAMLNDGETCAQRKLGAERLIKHGRSPAALDAIERARKGKGNGCLKNDLKAAEAAIKGRDPSN